MTLDETDLRSWIGRTDVSQDRIDAGQAQLMQTLFDREPDLKGGDPLPPLWHWIYFPELVCTSHLGRDGHAERGGFLPPVDLPRRMWAGGRFEFSQPLRLDEHTQKRSVIKDVAVKQGRTGLLCFVTVRHEYAGEDGRPCFFEEHDIVYRNDPAPCAPRPELPLPPGDGVWSNTILPSAVMLFRYSALTFNGHRIHYDRDYCRDIEGYPGLVFHGPLTATLLADLAMARGGDRELRGFRFRAVAPLFDTAPFVIRGKPREDDPHGLDLWAETPDGHLAMTASATFQD